MCGYYTIIIEHWSEKFDREIAKRSISDTVVELSKMDMMLFAFNDVREKLLTSMRKGQVTHEKEKKVSIAFSEGVLKNYKDLFLNTSQELDELISWADNEIKEWAEFRATVRVERIKRDNVEESKLKRV